MGVWGPHDGFSGFIRRWISSMSVCVCVCLCVRAKERLHENLVRSQPSAN